MTNAIELSREAQAAKMLLDALKVTFDGEDEDIALSAVEGETSLLEAIDEALARLIVLGSYQDGIDAAVERMKSRGSRLEAQAERIKSSIMLAMDAVNMKKLERPTATLSLAKSPDKAVITSEESLPTAYLVEKTEIKPDRKAILAALKEGKGVPGAELSNGGVSLRILTR